MVSLKTHAVYNKIPWIRWVPFMFYKHLYSRVETVKGDLQRLLLINLRVSRDKKNFNSNLCRYLIRMSYFGRQMNKSNTHIHTCQKQRILFRDLYSLFSLVYLKLSVHYVSTQKFYYMQFVLCYFVSPQSKFRGYLRVHKIVKPRHFLNMPVPSQEPVIDCMSLLQCLCVTCFTCLLIWPIAVTYIVYLFHR